MQEAIKAAVPAVCGIHHVHVWGLTPQELILTMHVDLDERIDNPTLPIRAIKQVLEERYDIAHSTIEVEFGQCADRFGSGTIDRPA